MRAGPIPGPSGGTYIFDLLVEQAMFSSHFQNFNSPVWFVFTADGIQQDKAVTSKKLIPCGTVYLGVASRMILSLPNFDQGYFKGSLWTNERILACAQMKLSRLPYNAPSEFIFPLLNSLDFKTEIVKLSIKATISSIQLNPNFRYPLVEPQQVHNFNNNCNNNNNYNYTSININGNQVGLRQNSSGFQFSQNLPYQPAQYNNTYSRPMNYQNPINNNFNTPHIPSSSSTFQITLTSSSNSLRSSLPPPNTQRGNGFI